ncbi:unnamed protein product [Effrenium voratum]|nr:unnamed protein product [Effrenium voratum]
MGRFSSWVQGQLESGKAETEVEEVRDEKPAVFRVENQQLRSQSNGIRYRLSPDLRDKHSKVALFGSKVKGIPCGGCWVKVGSRYLPTHIGTAQVLRPWEEDLPAKEFEEKECDKQLGKLLFGENESQGYAEARLEVPRRHLIRPETSEEGPLLALGSGALYEVMFERVAIRSAPSTAATTLEIKQKGDALELFAWDESRLWRQCPADTLCNTAGWVMLDHPDFGPLVRPKGAPFCGTALAPLCRAAAEAQLAELRRFLRAGGIAGSGQRVELDALVFGGGKFLG